MWIQTGVTVRKRLSWVVTSVTLTFDLWPWPFAWTLRWSLVITPENFMMIRWWEHSQKGVTDRRTDRRTDGQTDRQTENTICRAAWSQLKRERNSIKIRILLWRKLTSDQHAQLNNYVEVCLCAKAPLGLMHHITVSETGDGLVRTGWRLVHRTLTHIILWLSLRWRHNDHADISKSPASRMFTQSFIQA